jgi:hypothetical protein
MTQPIRLVLPDLLQHRLAKLAENAAACGPGQAERHAAFLGLRSDRARERCGGKRIETLPDAVSVRP